MRIDWIVGIKKIRRKSTRYSLFFLCFCFIPLLLVTRAHCEWWSVQFNRWNANEGKNLFHRRFYKWLILAKNTQSRHVEALPLAHDDIMLYQRQTLIGSSMPTNCLLYVCAYAHMPSTCLRTDGPIRTERNGTKPNETDGLELCVFRISISLSRIHCALYTTHRIEYTKPNQR